VEVPEARFPLRRNPREGSIAGVLTGIANTFDLPADRVKVAYVLAAVFSAGFPALLIYGLLWFILPEVDAVAPAPATAPMASAV
jgi:phage shock protein PspC (stress-responsive transcriptional regulator)